jgi:hypothetical protein
MRAGRWIGGVMLTAAAALALPGGCNPAENKADSAKDKPAAADKKKVDWRPEHGMPESICVQCNPALAAEYKKKGDWCEKHDRPDSQCFLCHPELKEKFAAEYRAKYGKEPPPMEDPSDPEKKGTE